MTSDARNDGGSHATVSESLERVTGTEGQTAEHRHIRAAMSARLAARASVPDTHSRTKQARRVQGAPRRRCGARAGERRVSRVIPRRKSSERDGVRRGPLRSDARQA